MENLRSKFQDNSYYDLKPVGRPSKPGKGAISEDLGRTLFKAGPSREAPKLSKKTNAPKDDMDFDTSDDDIDMFSSKSKKHSPPAKPVKKIGNMRKKVLPRPTYKAKHPGTTDDENISTPSTSQRSRPRTTSNSKHAINEDEDDMPPSNQLALKLKRVRKTSVHKESHNSPPLEELSPNRVERAKTFKSKTSKTEPAPFPMHVNSSKPSAKCSPPRPAPFPMNVPSPQPVPRKLKPAPSRSKPSPTHPRDISGRLGPQPFPMDIPPVKDGLDADEEVDELNIKPDDELTTYGGPRPFPMSLSQFPVKPLPDASGSKRSAYIESSSDEDGHRVNKKSRPSPEPDGFGSLSLDGNGNVDPSTICPYCDEPWPPTPSPTLTALLERTKRKSYSDPRPGNALGLKAPITAFIELCQRHRFEMTHLPLAIARGWPTRLDFTSLPKRIGAFRKELSKLVSRPEESIFWREVRDDAKEVGVMKIVSVSGQYATFERSQPGYYGEQGSIIIHQSLYSLFPPDSIPPAPVLPLTPDQFLTRVLVPETAVLLIQQDMSLPDKEQALHVLDESKKYGLAMFPEQAQGEDVAEVGENLARERAKARRKVLEERGEADADVKREIEKERRQARKIKGKGKADDSTAKQKGRTKESDVEIELSQESEREHKNKKGRPKARPINPPVAKAAVPKATHLRWDEEGDVEMVEEPTPRPVHAVRESSTTSWRAPTYASSSPIRPKASSRSSSVLPSSQQSAGEEWTFNMRDDDVDFDEMIEQNERKRREVVDSDSAVEILETPKPKPKPRRIVKEAEEIVIHSDKSASDAEPAPIEKPRPTAKPKSIKRDKVDETKIAVTKGALGQTKRRKKGNSKVVRSDSEESHSWLLDDSSDN